MKHTLSSRSVSFHPPDLPCARAATPAPVLCTPAMQRNAAPLQCQHSSNDEIFTTHAAPSPAHGAIEPRYRDRLLQRQSDRDAKLMNISPPLQLGASRMQLPCTNAAACGLDTAVAGFNDDAAGSTHAACSAPPLSGRPAPKALRAAVFADNAAHSAFLTGAVDFSPYSGITTSAAYAAPRSRPRRH